MTGIFFLNDFEAFMRGKTIETTGKLSAEISVRFDKKVIWYKFTLPFLC